MQPHAKDSALRTDHHRVNIERNAVNTVLRDSWREKLRQNEDIADLLDLHAKKMRALFGDVDYEVYIVENIIANLGNIGRDEVERYLRVLEALALGYVRLLGKDVTGVMLHGIVIRSRSTKALGKYYRSMVFALDKKSDELKERYESHRGIARKMGVRLKKSERSIFSFLRTKEISRLRSRMSKRNEKLAEMEAKILEYATLQSSIQSMVYRTEVAKSAD